MSSQHYPTFDPARWKACLTLLIGPLPALSPIQRPAALVLHYDGQVQNGGHSAYFDSSYVSHAEELLRALKALGAHAQARILAEARFLKHSVKEEGESENYVWEATADLDRQYYELEPDVPELLARYFDAHREDFPQ